MIFRYQLLIGFLFALLEIPHGWCMLLHKFIIPSVDHWCVQSTDTHAWSTDHWTNFTELSKDSCSVFSPNINNSHVSLIETTPCTKWDYDTSQFQNTIVERFDLVCQDKMWAKTSSSVFFAGTGVGVFIAGLLSDHLGRKNTLLILLQCHTSTSRLIVFFNPSIHPSFG